MLGWHLGRLLGDGDWLPLFAVLLGLNLLCFLTALPVAFPSDVSRPNLPAAAIKGFFVDCWRIVCDAEACGTVLDWPPFRRSSRRGRRRAACEDATQWFR